ncbi:2',5'-phosphodiesterase 12-like [Xenia sp. Carnegie-2017]|uniref:2',5'-phosphodiesterase 12-like n=1 Tax=Xenia sp. Carnegie-2017 TaxID=2897299 RepID=UPI001F0502FB|nr:2',5'-phosphodiesterase 12-like [Xenia sp. Carnegie-2017]
MNYLSVYSETVNGILNLKLLFNLHGKSFRMSRNSAESIGKTLKRIGISVQKAQDKGGENGKKKGRKQEISNHIHVQLLWPNGQIVNEEISNIQGWKTGNMLNIGEFKFSVEENTPIVNSAKIPSVIMANFPIVPTLKLEFANEANSQFKWFKCSEKLDVVNSCTLDVDENLDRSGESLWIEVSQNFIYEPAVDDIGCIIRFSCKAGSHEKTAHNWFDVTSVSVVQAAPGFMPFESRHLYTIKPTIDEDILRVVSYNILADCYLDDEATCETLYGYCPKYALEIDYRQQLLLKEIVGYHGDIVCLQECGRRLFDHYLKPMMNARGYTGTVRYKSGVMLEGEAIFFDKMKFELVSQNMFELKESLLHNTCNIDLLQNIQAFPVVYEKLISRTTLAQVVVLQSIPSPQDYICIVNTHLYYKPDSSYIRNLQIMIVLNEVQKSLNELENRLEKERPGGYRIGVVFCGDFNSLPGSGVVQLLSEGFLQSSHQDWSLQIVDDEDDFIASNVLEMSSFSHNLNLQNVCGFPDYTAYTHGFSGVIDYVFASKAHFDVHAVIPVPSIEEIQLYLALPSPVMPSDHVALVCELKWKEKKKCEKS